MLVEGPFKVEFDKKEKVWCVMDGKDQLVIKKQTKKLAENYLAKVEANIAKVKV